MAEEYIELRRDFIEKLKTMPGDALKVYFYLVARQKTQKGLKIGLSLPELARSIDVGTESTKFFLWWLAEQQLIVITPKGTNHVIEVHPYYPGEPATLIPFTYKNTDETKLLKAEQEIARLQLRATRDILGRESGVANACKGDERDVVMEIERDLGRGLSREEAYTLGRCMSAFGPDRVKSTWRRKAATAKNPLPALSAMMWNETTGKPAKPREITRKEPIIRDL